jgi:hypothetical protein
MSEKLSQERLEEISREPFKATNNEILYMADELLMMRSGFDDLCQGIADAQKPTAND